MSVSNRMLTSPCVPVPAAAVPDSRLVERQIQLEHVDARPAEKAERRRFRVGANQLAHALDRARPGPRATRGACSSAAAGGMCGSRPAPLAVTISDGTWLAGDALLLR